MINIHIYFIFDGHVKIYNKNRYTKSYLEVMKSKTGKLHKFEMKFRPKNILNVKVCHYKIEI